MIISSTNMMKYTPILLLSVTFGIINTNNTKRSCTESVRPINWWNQKFNIYCK